MWNEGTHTFFSAQLHAASHHCMPHFARWFVNELMRRASKDIINERVAPSLIRSPESEEAYLERAKSLRMGEIYRFGIYLVRDYRLPMGTVSAESRDGDRIPSIFLPFHRSVSRSKPPASGRKLPISDSDDDFWDRVDKIANGHRLQPSFPPPTAWPPRWRETFAELKKMWSSAYSCWCSRQSDLSCATASSSVSLPFRNCGVCYNEIPLFACSNSSGFVVNCWTNDNCGHTVCAPCGLKVEKRTDPRCPICRTKWSCNIPRHYLERSSDILSCEEVSPCPEMLGCEAASWWKARSKEVRRCDDWSSDDASCETGSGDELWAISEPQLYPSRRNGNPARQWQSPADCQDGEEGAYEDWK